MSLFGDLNLAEFATVLRTAAASFGHIKPPSGFEELKMKDLGINQDGTTFTSRNGRGKAIVAQQGDDLIVAFRGTDHFNDVLDYDNISASKNYYRQFERLLKNVASYVRHEDLNVTFTGFSLGGAVANIIADHAGTHWNKAFADAHFVGIASPYLSNNHKVDILNVGFSNDIVFHLAPGSWDNGRQETATNHIFLYQQHAHTKTDNLSDRVSVHRIGHYGDAVEALADTVLDDGTMLSDRLTRHSFVLFDHTHGILRAGRLEHPFGTFLTAIGANGRDRMTGASSHNHGSHVEWFFGRGGNDSLNGRDGNDVLYGGTGDDALLGGSGKDYLSGGKGDDRLSLADNGDRVLGGAGDDTFLVDGLLPLNAKGRPSENGTHTARIVIDDFTPGVDVLNLRRLDGNLDHKGDQPLHFAGYEQYDASDGLDALEKGFVNDTRPGSVTIFNDKSGDTLVIVNMDGDRGREVEIVLRGGVGDIHHDILF